MATLIQDLRGLLYVRNKFTAFFKERYATDTMGIKEFSSRNENMQLIVIMDWLHSINININTYRFYFDVYFMNKDIIPEFDKKMGLATDLIVEYYGDYYLYHQQPYKGTILDGYKEATKLTLKFVDNVKYI